MYFFIRFIPILTAATIWGGFQFFQTRPKWILRLFGQDDLTIELTIYLGLAVVGILALFLLIMGIGYPLRSRLRFLLFPALFWLCSLVTFLFSDFSTVQLGLTALAVFGIWIWFESLFLYWQRPSSYQPYTLPRLAQYLYLLALFVTFVSIIGLQTLLQIPLWITASAILLSVTAIQFDYCMLNQFDKKESIVLTLVGSLLTLQFYLVLNLLPTHFFMYGLIMALFFYVWMSLIRHILHRQKNLRVIRGQVLAGSIGTVMAILTALFLKI